MKKYQEILFSITAVVMTLATALPAAAAQIDQLAPVKIMGTVVEKTEDTLTVSQQLSGSYPGEYILHISEETKILDSSSGMPVSAENINQGAAICAYGGGAVTASIPPQTTGLMILTNIPEAGASPSYIRTESYVRKNGGYELTASDGSVYQVSDQCQVFPYLTRNMLYPSSIYEGSWCLIWADNSGNAQKIMMFPPYGSEQEGKQAGWSLESGTAGTSDAVWTYDREDGTKAEGWIQDKGKWYYLDPETKIMKVRFLQLDGKTYYLQQDGSMLTTSKTFTPDESGVLW